MAQTERVEIVEEPSRPGRLCARLGVFDGIGAVVGVQAHIGEYLELQEVRQLREFLQKRLFDVGMGVAHGQPAAVLRVPDLHRHIAEHRFRILVEFKRPVAVHDHVELVDLVVQADVHELLPFFKAPQLAVEADAAIAGVPGERGRDRAHRQRRIIDTLPQHLLLPGGERDPPAPAEASSRW